MQVFRQLPEFRQFERNSSYFRQLEMVSEVVENGYFRQFDVWRFASLNYGLIIQITICICTCSDRRDPGELYDTLSLLVVIAPPGAVELTGFAHYPGLCKWSPSPNISDLIFLLKFAFIPTKMIL